MTEEITDHEAYGAMMYSGMRQKEAEGYCKGRRAPSMKEPKEVMMTSTNWRKNWVCLSSQFDTKVGDEMVKFLSEEKVDQHWWQTYGGLRSMLEAMGLDIGKNHIWHKTTYVGSSILELETYVNTMKRIYGG